MAKKKIGFIGMGAMGIHMAKNLVKAGYALTVYDINPQPVKDLVSLGAGEAKSSADAAKGVEVVITMLPQDEQVR
jgi:3-hydroxyisobutyrate dehydrogenase-like beta-hydroxyacid dehydrogenase